MLAHGALVALLSFAGRCSADVGGSPLEIDQPKASGVGPGWTLIPLPAFTYNKNEGSWVGALTPIFRANDKGQVEDIFAPLYLHNRLIGETFTFNYFGYRDETKQYNVVLSHATKIEHAVDASYKNTAASGGRFIVGAQANVDKGAFNRFFGFGNLTTDKIETNYTKSDSVFKLFGGINFTQEIALIAAERYRAVAIENGAVQTLPQTLQAFPDIPGIDGADVIGQSLMLQFDSRDNQLTPLRGTYGTLFAEYNENVKFSERNRWWRLTAEAKRFFPHAEDRAVFVAHWMADGIVGQDENSALEDTVEQVGVNDLGNPTLNTFTSKRLVRRGVPFYERPTLGGETTLRGFGGGRFVSNVAWLVNFEERVAVARKTIMGNPIELELAPFLDIGRVGRALSSDGIVRHAQINPGVGVRMLARPNIAGRFDIGWGKDGTAIYVGLNYPF